jgi:membrane-associated phospholipid phosphatase
MPALFKTMASHGRDAAAAVRRHPILFAGLAGGFGLLAACTIHHDAAWSESMYPGRSEALLMVARRFSALGDYTTGTLAVVAITGLAGWRLNSRWVGRAALACLLSATVAGLAATTLRTLTGRPRPSAAVADRFTGPTLNGDYQSFGSAHAATSLGTSTALAVALPEVGVPVFALSLGVPWARFYMHDHYVTDLIVGGGIGIWCGLAFGLAARRRSEDAASPA